MPQMIILTKQKGSSYSKKMFANHTYKMKFMSRIYTEFQLQPLNSKKQTDSKMSNGL
jgi:hypothetical protein